MKCDVCNKEVNYDNSVVACGIFGVHSHRYCIDCISQQKEVYSDMVHYIADAGHYPEDINSTYKSIVKNQLKLHNKTEQEFITDVEKAILLW